MRDDFSRGLAKIACVIGRRMVESALDGEVAEWLKAAACKGCYTVKSRIGGSNPSPLRQLTQGFRAFGPHLHLK